MAGSTRGFQGPSRGGAPPPALRKKILRWDRRLRPPRDRLTPTFSPRARPVAMSPLRVKYRRVRWQSLRMQEATCPLAAIPQEAQGMVLLGALCGHPSLRGPPSCPENSAGPLRAVTRTAVGRRRPKERLPGAAASPGLTRAWRAQSRLVPGTLLRAPFRGFVWGRSGAARE